MHWLCANQKYWHVSFWSSLSFTFSRRDWHSVQFGCWLWFVLLALTRRGAFGCFWLCHWQLGVPLVAFSYAIVTTRSVFGRLSILLSAASHHTNTRAIREEGKKEGRRECVAENDKRPVGFKIRRTTRRKDQMELAKGCLSILNMWCLYKEREVTHISPCFTCFQLSKKTYVYSSLNILTIYIAKDTTSPIGTCVCRSVNGYVSLQKIGSEKTPHPFIYKKFNSDNDWRWYMMIH